MSYQNEIAFLRDKPQVHVPVLFDMQVTGGDYHDAGTFLRSTKEKIVFHHGNEVVCVHFDTHGTVHHEAGSSWAETRGLSAGTDPDNLESITIEEDMVQISDHRFKTVNRAVGASELISHAIALREAIVTHDSYKASFNGRDDNWRGRTMFNRAAAESMESKTGQYCQHHIALTLPIDSTLVLRQHQEQVLLQNPELNEGPLTTLVQISESLGTDSKAFLDILSKEKAEQQENIVNACANKSPDDIRQFYHNLQQQSKPASQPPRYDPSYDEPF